MSITSEYFLGEEERFFRAMLADVHGPTVPLNLIHPRRDSDEITEADRLLTDALGARLRTHAQRLGVSLASLFHLAYAQVIARTSCRTSVVFGTVLESRQGSTRAEQATNSYTKILPIRLDLDETGAQECVQRTHALLAELLRHIDSSPALFQRCGNVAAGVPLFSSLLNYRRHRRDSFEKNDDPSDGPARDAQRVLDDELTHYPLILSVEDLGHGFRLTTRIVSPASPERFCGYIQQALEHLVYALNYAPHMPVHRLEVIPPDERALLLDVWNRTESPYPQHLSIHRLFERQAEMTPEATAVICGQTSLTYRALNGEANRLAHYLLALGVRPDAPIALCLERSPLMYIGLLAILKAGGAYVPLDPTYPSKRLNQILADAAPQILLCDYDGLNVVGQFGLQSLTVLALDASSTPWAGLPQSDPDPCALGLSSTNLAYIIYTSGSTGAPKGVMVEHRSVIPLVVNTNYVQLAPTDRVAQTSNVAFDAATFEIWGALLNGATSIVLPKSVLLSTLEFASLVKKHRITAMFLTPALFNQHVQRAPDAFQTLDHLVIGGDVLDPQSVKRLIDSIPPKRLVNGYGPTETTTFATWCEVPLGSTHLPPSFPIGRPIANTRIYLLDSNCEPVPLGAVGEIYIGGPGVARGYLNRPDWTAERFLPDPFNPHTEGRMYRTGDQARYLVDGNLMFLGRVDQQIKIRGFRIEPGEIEAHLVSHPSVQDAAVLAREDSHGAKRLVAYIVPKIAAKRNTTLDLETVERISEWKWIYEKEYSQKREDVLGESFQGWNSSVDGSAIPVDQMREWRENTVTRILALKPTRVLEIGVGTGLILAKVAPKCDLYWATDISEEAIKRLRSQSEVIDTLAERVQVSCQAADDIRGLPKDCFDTIILNSVVQYFPDSDYLLAVLRNCIELLAPGGTLFLGDVRNLSLAECLAASIEFAQFSAGIGRHLSINSISRRTALDKELSIAPTFFSLLPQYIAPLRSVDVRIKHSEHVNEMSCYRYDVFLTKAPSIPFSVSVAERIVWGETIGDVASLEAYLARCGSQCVRLVHVPNMRIERVVAALEAIRAGASEEEIIDTYVHPSSAPEIAVLNRMAANFGYETIPTWSSGDNVGEIDVIFIRQWEGALTDSYLSNESDAANLPKYVSDPLKVRRAGQLLAALREKALRELPEYMIPSAFVLLDALPTNPNGKVDRMALPAPEADAFARETYELPQGPVERALAGIWEELFGITPIGRHDNFLKLGGHSLLAVQLLNRLRGAFGIELPVATVFGQPTVCTMAGAIANARHLVTAEVSARISRVSRHAALAMSFAQQRMWFLAQLDERSRAYNVPFSLQLNGPLDVRALRDSLTKLLARHEALRTVFVVHNGEPRIELLSADAPMPFIEHDLRGAPDANAQLAQLCAAEANAPFDFTNAPSIRACLIRLGDQSHYFLLTLHHIVCDGWSIGILSREISALYRAFSNGQPNPLTPLLIQYPDYAAWQRKHLTKERLQAQSEYWRETLVGAPHFLELPTDRSRPSEQSFDGAHLPVQIDTELTASLRRLSQQHGSSLFTTLLSAWAVVLTRLSSQTDLVIGTATANRNRREIEPLIGLFVNTLALRINLSGNPSVAELLSRVRECALSAQDHQDLPFERVVEILQPPRRLDRTPIFQVIFTWQNKEAGTFDLPGLTVHPTAAVFNRAKFDLELELWEEHGGIAGALRYVTALFDAATIERHVGYLLNALRAMVADSQQAVGCLPLLGSEERTLLLDTWNNTGSSYQQELCIHQLFEHQVERVSAATAVIHGMSSLTYCELNNQANRLAHYLIALGVHPDEPVALCLERSPAMIVGLLAILKAGGAYIPLDPAYPSQRLIQFLTDAAPRILLCDAAGFSALGETAVVGITVLALDTQSMLWADQSQSNPDPSALALTSNHLAYIIYTSGSTGQPKGVMVEHRNVCNYLHWAETAYASQVGSVVSSSLAFDATVTSLFAPLLRGGSITLLPVQEEIETLQVFLTQRKCPALVKLTPTLLQHLAERFDTEQRVDITNSFIIGGEALSSSVIRSWLASGTQSKFFNEYGPTETTVGCVVYEFSAEFDSATVPVGRPIANTQIYLLDSNCEPVPLGAIGEIYIGGTGVARGYLNRPDLTAERFLPDSFSCVPNARMYRTGDLARYLPDGNLVYVGRNDQQVKIRGFRIEPAEIQLHLSEHPAVRDAVVLAREDSPGERRLVAYFTIKSELASLPEGLAAALRAHVAARLPAYMVPEAFVRLEDLPLSPNGKLDRKALPPPEVGDLARMTYQSPRGSIEKLLSTIWEELLGASRISRNDDFFALGGHSLLAVRLISHLRRAFGIELSLTSLFANPTVEALAVTIGETQRHTALETSVAITPRAQHDDLPLSFSQQRMWFLAQLEGGSQAYNVPVSLHLRGPLDPSALRDSLNALFARHDALRSVFVSVDGEPHVKLLPPEVGIPLVEHDLRGIPEVHEVQRRLATEETANAFDLTQGPLIRARLIRLTDQEHIFLLTLHHIVSDGWSMGILVRELSAFYRAFSTGNPDPLPPLLVQYPDYAAWQRQHLTGERVQIQAQYWRETLADAPEFLELPTDRPRPPIQSFEGVYASINIDAALTADLKSLSRQHGITLFMTLLAAWAAVLSRLSGQRDVLVGTPTANRNRPEVEPLIGLFVNTLALRINLSGNPSVAELLSRVRECVLSAQDHQDLPFEQVVEILQPPRRLDRTPIFQVMIAWQNNEEQQLALPDLAVRAIPAPFDRVKFDLELGLWEEHGGIAGALRYVTALFDAATIERHVGYLLNALRAMVADSQQAVGCLPLLGSEERTLLLDTWNNTGSSYQQELCIHQLFEHQVERVSAATAVIHGMSSLTYCELNNQANRLAHYLIALGVHPDEPVALCLERSPAMIVGLLAILKAGGAYIPLDPAYPSQRLIQFLTDAAPRILLCDAAGFSALGETAVVGITVLALDTQSMLWADQSQSNPDPSALALTSNHLAYIIYTSGSTGQPKGTTMPHSAVVNLIQWNLTTFLVEEGSRTLQFAALSFDAAFHEIFSTFARGETLVLLDEWVRRDPRALNALLTNQSISRIFIPPLMLQALAEYSEISAQQPLGLKDVVVAGEQLQISQQIRALFRHMPDCKLHNYYGPTETHVVTAFTLEAPSKQWPYLPPIGRPVVNTKIYLLDGCGELVPLGAIGEVFIGGVAVARGYLNRPDLTAERFLPDPFSGCSEARMYRTGDLARYLPDGNIVFLGRNDQQVKIRGFRIEPAEIEARLIEHSAIREAVVLARQENSGEKRLVAYITIDPDLSTPPGGLIAALRTYLAGRLPEYMVPVAFVCLDTLPLSPIGKLDRTALPAPEASAFTQESYEAPRGPTEQALSSIWKELLGIERISRHDNFFELGGHSLLAVRLISRLPRNFGIELSLTPLFGNPTLEALAATIDKARLVDRTASLPTVTPIEPRAGMH